MVKKKLINSKQQGVRFQLDLLRFLVAKWRPEEDSNPQPAP